MRAQPLPMPGDAPPAAARMQDAATAVAFGAAASVLVAMDGVASPVQPTLRLRHVLYPAPFQEGPTAFAECTDVRERERVLRAATRVRYPSPQRRWPTKLAALVVHG